MKRSRRYGVSAVLTTDVWSYRNLRKVGQVMIVILYMYVDIRVPVF